MVLEYVMMMVTVMLMMLLAGTQAFPSTIVIMDKQNQSTVPGKSAKQFNLVDSSNPFKSFTAIRKIKDIKSVVLISSTLCGSFIHSIISAVWTNRTLLCVGKFYYQPKREEVTQNKCCAEPTQQPQAKVSEIISPSTAVPIGRVLIGILHRSQWKSVIVFYDSLADHIVSELTSGSLQARLALYNVGSGDNFNPMLKEAYNTEEDVNKNILIIGSLHLTMGVLMSLASFHVSSWDSLAIPKLSHPAFEASRMNDRSTGVISLSSWLVVLPAAHRLVVEDMAPRLDNVVVVSYPEIEETSSWKNTTSGAWNGVIHTLLYKGQRRELSLVGEFDLLGDVHLSEELFPNLKLGFNGRLLTVSTKEYAPYVSIQRNGSSVEFDGLCVDLLSNVAKALNFTYKLTEPPDGQWGTYLNNSWNGLIRQLQFKEVDIVLAPLTVREDREEVMDFTYPYFYDAAGAIFKRPGLRRWSTLLKPFKWEVLLCLAIVVAVVTLLLHIMENERRKFVAECQRRNTEKRVPEDTFWYIWGTFLKHGSYVQPVTSSGRVLVSFLSLFCIIVSAAYSGNLIAFLSISRESVPFRTSQEMAEQTVYKWGTVNGSLWQLQIANSNQSDFQKLWQGMRTFSESDPDVLAPSSSIHKRKVEAGNYVFFSDRSVMEIWAQENCQLTLLEETFRQMTYGMGLPNNSPYRDMFSKVLMKFEKAGLLRLLREKWWPDAVKCEDNVKVKTHVIEIEDLQSAFYVPIIGFFLAFLILVLENVRILGIHKLSLLKMTMKQNIK